MNEIIVLINKYILKTNSIFRIIRFEEYTQVDDKHCDLSSVNIELQIQIKYFWFIKVWKTFKIWTANPKDVEDIRFCEREAAELLENIINY